jgi:hypothetical protein
MSTEPATKENNMENRTNEALSQSPTAIKARAYRAAASEKRRLEKAALGRAKAKLTDDEWNAVENHFANLYYG